MLRKIIRIDEERCDGCGKCVTDCAEGALEVRDGKAHLVRESFCDGLGSCLNCPNDALSLEERECDAFDEERVQTSMTASQPSGTQAAAVLGGPGLTQDRRTGTPRTWPIQLRLIPQNAAFLRNSHILLAAQCSGFVLSDLHTTYLPGKVLIIACPKLEPRAELESRLHALFRTARPVAITILRMTVPCCGGLEQLVSQAQKTLTPKIPVETVSVRNPYVA